MPRLSCLFLATVAAFSTLTARGADGPAPSASARTSSQNSAMNNPAIDMEEFLKLSVEAAEHRRTRRVSEADFIRMSREPNTLVLDARSKEKYDLLHIRGAVNLSFPDITVESVARVIPDKKTRVLIYCNNNFQNAEKPFPSKLPSAALNLSTYVSLYSYGYRNVYELAPLLDPKRSKLSFEGTAKP